MTTINYDQTMRCLVFATDDIAFLPEGVKYMREQLKHLNITEAILATLLWMREPNAFVISVPTTQASRVLGYFDTLLRQVLKREGGDIAYDDEDGLFDQRPVMSTLIRRLGNVASVPSDDGSPTSCEHVYPDRISAYPLKAIWELNDLDEDIEVIILDHQLRQLEMRLGCEMQKVLNDQCIYIGSHGEAALREAFTSLNVLRKNAEFLPIVRHQFYTESHENVKLMVQPFLNVKKKYLETTLIEFYNHRPGHNYIVLYQNGVTVRCCPWNPLTAGYQPFRIGKYLPASQDSEGESGLRDWAKYVYPAIQPRPLEPLSIEYAGSSSDVDESKRSVLDWQDQVPLGAAVQIENIRDPENIIRDPDVTAKMVDGSPVDWETSQPYDPLTLPRTAAQHKSFVKQEEEVIGRKVSARVPRASGLNSSSKPVLGDENRRPSKFASPSQVLPPDTLAGRRAALEAALMSNDHSARCRRSDEHSGVHLTYPLVATSHTDADLVTVTELPQRRRPVDLHTITSSEGQVYSQSGASSGITIVPRPTNPAFEDSPSGNVQSERNKEDLLAGDDLLPLPAYGALQPQNATSNTQLVLAPQVMLDGLPRSYGLLVDLEEDFLIHPDFAKKTNEANAVRFHNTMNQHASRPNPFVGRLPRLPDIPAPEPPAQAKPATLDPLPSFIRNSLVNFEDLTRNLPSMPGRLVLEAEFGRILTQNTQLSNHRKLVTATNGHLILKSPDQLLQTFEPVVPNYTNVLTTWYSDIHYLIDMKDDSANDFWIKSPVVSSAVYRFHCFDRQYSTTQRDPQIIHEPFVIEVDTETFKAAATFSRDMGVIFVHGTKRHWDFQVTAKIETRVDCDTMNKDGFHREFAMELKKSLTIPPGRKYPELSFTIPGRLTESCMMVVVHRTTHYKSVDHQSLLKVTEVLELQTQRRQTHEGCSEYNCTFEPKTRLKGEEALWYKVSISSTKADETFKQNIGLQFGETARWTPELLSELAVAKAIFGPACSMLKRMDSVGFYNNSMMQLVVEERASDIYFGRKKKKADDPEKEVFW